MSQIKGIIIDLNYNFFCFTIPIHILPCYCFFRRIVCKLIIIYTSYLVVISCVSNNNSNSILFLVFMSFLRFRKLDLMRVNINFALYYCQKLYCIWLFFITFYKLKKPQLQTQTYFNVYNELTRLSIEHIINKILFEYNLWIYYVFSIKYCL